MKHLNEIKALIKTLMHSTRIHALVVLSAPGWGKSSTIDHVFTELGISYRAAGSFATPLSLYNTLCEHPDMTLVFDDSAGIFGDAVAMAILKAATWPSGGSSGQRIVSWSSTGDRASKSSTNFKGKIILLTNTIPSGKSAESFLSRSLFLSLSFQADEVAEMLREASKDKAFYEDTFLSGQVAEFLASEVMRRDPSRISLRTLQMGYELAKANPDDWKMLFGRLLPRTESPKEVVSQLDQGKNKLNEQIIEFMRTTGLSRRTFYNYRNKMRNETKSEVLSVDATAKTNGELRG